MPSYILRDIPADLWVRVRERAERDGRHLRGLILWLLTKYADGEIADRPARTPKGDNGPA